MVTPSTQKRYVHADPRNVALCRKRVLADVITDVEMSASRVTQMGPIRERQRDLGHTEEKLMLKRSQGLEPCSPQAKELPEPPGAGRGEEDAPLEPSKEVQPCQHLDLRFGLQKCERASVCCFKSPGVWCLSMAATGN